MILWLLAILQDTPSQTLDEAFSRMVQALNASDHERVVRLASLDRRFTFDVLNALIDQDIARKAQGRPMPPWREALDAYEKLDTPVDTFRAKVLRDRLARVDAWTAEKAAEFIRARSLTEADRAALERRIRDLEPFDDWLTLNAAVFDLVRLDSQLQRWPDVKSGIERMLQIFRDHGDRQGEAIFLAKLGHVLLNLRDPIRAFECYESAIRTARELGFQEQEAATLVDVTNHYLDAGRFVDAKRHLIDLVKILRQTGPAGDLASALTRLGNALKSLGEFDEALRCHKKDGKVTGHGGSWLAGEKNARYGLMMPGTPLLGARYYQEVAPEQAMDRAEIVSLTDTLETPSGKYDNVLKIEETTPLEKGKEYKYFARGVGLIRDGNLKLAKIKK